MTEAHEPIEDIPYATTVDDFAIEDEFEKPDELDTSRDTEMVKEIRAYIKKSISQHNTFDVLHLPQNATSEEKSAVFDEMFNHKGLVHHLRQIEEIIKDKIGGN